MFTLMICEAEGCSGGGERRRVLAGKAAPLVMSCSAAFRGTWRCLYPFPGLDLQLLQLAKVLCAACLGNCLLTTAVDT